MEQEVKLLKVNLVSVIIVSYNCSNVITDNLVSCSRDKNVEIIIVDNASSDSTVEIIQSFNGENIHLIINNDNLGYTKACNQGIKKAKGKYIMLLNPDASLIEDCLFKLSEYLEGNLETGAVAPCLYYPDGRFQNYTRTFPSVLGLWVESFVPSKFWNLFKSYRKFTCQDIDFTKIQLVEQPAGAAIMFRNRWLMDEHYFIYTSDVDLCKTVVEDGFKIVQIPEAKVIHHQSKGGTDDPKLRMYLDLDNYFGMQYFFKKHNQKVNSFFYLSIFSFSLLFRVFLAIFEGKDKFVMRWNKFKFFLQKKNFISINGE